MRVLLVEDDALLGAAVRIGLEQQGHAVDWVRDGVQAENAALLNGYGAVLLDLGLPRQDGMQVQVTCDNCAADLTAKIYFIATTAEYTPPVIYSLDERNKLVYLIQARPSRPDALRVGQPISVYLNPKTPVADKR